MKSFLLQGIVKSDVHFLAETIALLDEMSLVKQTFNKMLDKAAGTAEWEETNAGKKFIKKYVGEVSRDYEEYLKARFKDKVREVSAYGKFVPHWLLLERIFGLFDLKLPDGEVALPEIEKECLKIEGLFLSGLAKTEKLDETPGMLEFFEDYTKTMAETIIDNFSKLSSENQAQALENMLEAIKGLPEEQKEAFRSSLEIDEITRDSLRKAIIGGGGSVALTSYVSFAGFGAYTLLSTMIASLASIAGLTLPFSIYTSASSLLFVLSNPLTMILFLSGGGFFLEKITSAKMRKEFQKGLMAQLVFISENGEGSWKDTRDFLEARKVAGLYGH